MFIWTIRFPIFHTMIPFHSLWSGIFEEYDSESIVKLKSKMFACLLVCGYNCHFWTPIFNPLLVNFVLKSISSFMVKYNTQYSIIQASFIHIVQLI